MWRELGPEKRGSLFTHMVGAVEEKDADGNATAVANATAFLLAEIRSATEQQQQQQLREQQQQGEQYQQEIQERQQQQQQLREQQQQGEEYQQQIRERQQRGPFNELGPDGDEMVRQLRNLGFVSVRDHQLKKRMGSEREGGPAPPPLGRWQVNLDNEARGLLGDFSTKECAVCTFGKPGNNS
jgi:TolA-binding protein